MIDVAKETVRPVLDHAFKLERTTFLAGRRMGEGSSSGGPATPGRCPEAVFVVNVDGTGLRRLTPWKMLAGDPDWSPDGPSSSSTPGPGRLP